MKKGKFIAGALVLSMGLLGTGYAYWTDALSINTTVSTGNLNVEFTGGGNAQQNGDNSEDIITETLTKEQDLKDFKVTIKNMYPGAEAVFNRSMENKGTIPAQIDTIEVKGVEAMVEPSLLNAIDFRVAYGELGKSYEYEETGTGMAGLTRILQGLEGKVLMNEGNQKDGYTEASLAIWAKIPEELGNEFEEKIGDIEIKINWQQVNAPSSHVPTPLN